MQVTAYNKFIAAALGLLVSLGLFQMGQDDMAVVSQGISVLLVYLLPNKKPNA